MANQDLDMFRAWLDILRLKASHLHALSLTILAPTNTVRPQLPGSSMGTGALVDGCNKDQHAQPTVLTIVAH